MRKYSLKNKDARKLIKDFIEFYKVEDPDEYFAKSRNKVDCIDIDESRIYFIDERPYLLKTEKGLFPTLIFKEFLAKLPHVIVDIGAIGHICNGADVMAPGIREINGDFKQSSTIVVKEEKYNKSIALGLSIYDVQDLKSIKKGRVIENIHYVGDMFWEIIIKNKAKS
jgi:PUA-domain protein